MDEIIGGLRWQAALVYIDDLLIYSTTWRDHLTHLETIMKAAITAGLVFSVNKCHFGHSDVNLLGHGLSRYGLHTLTEKVQTITSLAPPKTMGQLHRVLGMFRYYRSFIYQFSKIAKPLNDLKSFQSENNSKPDRKAAYNSKTPIPWSDPCQASFDELKKRLSSAPILAHPIFDRPFILYTDASADGFAAVLAQVWEH